MSRDHKSQEKARLERMDDTKNTAIFNKYLTQHKKAIR